MNRYQLVFLTSPDLKKEEKESLFEGLRKIFSKIEVKIVKENFLGRKFLAYPIKRQKEAEYFAWDVEAKNVLKLTALNTFLNREADIIRYLLVRARFLRQLADSARQGGLNG